jgi:hypothetical protein
LPFVKLRPLYGDSKDWPLGTGQLSILLKNLPVYSTFHELQVQNEGFFSTLLLKFPKIFRFWGALFFFGCFFGS